MKSNSRQTLSALKIILLAQQHLPLRSRKLMKWNAFFLNDGRNSIISTKQKNSIQMILFIWNFLNSEVELRRECRRTDCQAGMVGFPL